MLSVDEYRDANVYKGNHDELMCTCGKEDCWHLNKTWERLEYQRFLKAKGRKFDFDPMKTWQYKFMYDYCVHCFEVECLLTLNQKND
jgi:hypothetical protein